MQTFQEKYNEIMSANLTRIRQAGRLLFVRKVFIAVSKFVADNRFVSSDESARPGQWDNSITPFAVEPMDSFTDPAIDEIVFLGSAQVVKTEIIKNIIAYIIAHLPAPTLLIYPTDGDARDFSTEKLDPMINNNSFLRDKIKKAKSNSKENKTLYKKFTGPGFLAIAGGRVPQALARRSIKYVIVDDAARVGNAGNEGSATWVAKQRMESYKLLGAKLMQFSTPTIDGICPITEAYSNTDQREYHVPCPHCSELNVLDFDNIKWEKETDLLGKTTKHLPETAMFECQHCHVLIEEKDKYNMISSGKWIAKFPEIKDKRGYKINRLYSPFSTWEMLVREFLSAKDNPDKLQVFYNTSLARTWKISAAEDIDQTQLEARCEQYLTAEEPYLPNDILILTCTVDTHPDRFEVEIDGWGIDEENWLVHYEQIFGDPDKQSTRDELTHFIFNKRWMRKDGLEMKIGQFYQGRWNYATFIDSQGRNTEAVYEYCKQYQSAGIIAIKGRANESRIPLLSNRSLVGKNRDTYLQNVGVNAAKEIIWNRLKIKKAPDAMERPLERYMHFTTAFCDKEYFDMLLSERPFKGVDRFNRPTIIWKKLSTATRNEAWDLKVYQLALVRSLSINYMALRDNLLKKVAELKTKNEVKDKIDTKQTVKAARKQKSFTKSWM